MIRIEAHAIELGTLTTQSALSELTQLSLDERLLPIDDVAYRLHALPDLGLLTHARRASAVRSRFAEAITRLCTHDDDPFFLCLSAVDASEGVRDAGAQLPAWLPPPLKEKARTQVSYQGVLGWWVQLDRILALIEAGSSVWVGAYFAPQPTPKDLRLEPEHLYTEGWLLLKVVPDIHGLIYHGHTCLPRMAALADLQVAHQQMAKILTKRRCEYLHDYFPPSLPLGSSLETRELWNHAYHGIAPLMSDQTAFRLPLAHIGECGPISPLITLLYWQALTNSHSHNGQRFMVQSEGDHRGWAAMGCWGRTGI
ncbi:hypothetical protein ACKC9G_07785 [Pokkaliibacter sp. CJK22405]|uniref:hypothetical protein n=1 Tax=Pokkaliibacter sp. CJK22405 TaxID=3384615 RepID=UPI003984BFC7